MTQSSARKDAALPPSQPTCHRCHIWLVLVVLARYSPLPLHLGHKVCHLWCPQAHKIWVVCRKGSLFDKNRLGCILHTTSSPRGRPTLLFQVCRPYLRHCVPSWCSVYGFGWFAVWLGAWFQARVLLMNVVMTSLFFYHICCGFYSMNFPVMTKRRTDLTN